MLYKGVAVEAPIEDVRQAEGGFAALDFLRKCVANEVGFSEQVVKRAHELVFAEALDPATRGSYRTVEVEIAGTSFQPTPAAYLPERMRSLVSSIVKSRKHAVLKVALFHLEFESIHPFINADGRTERLMSNLILMLGGYEPVNIQAESRARYIAAIRAFQVDDDPYPFVAFFCFNLKDRLEKVLSLLSDSECEAKHDPIPSSIEAYLEGSSL